MESQVIRVVVTRSKALITQNTSLVKKMNARNEEIFPKAMFEKTVNNKKFGEECDRCGDTARYSVSINDKDGEFLVEYYCSKQCMLYSVVELVDNVEDK